MTRPYAVDKDYRHSRPQPGCHLPNSPWAGIIKLFPPWQSLVSDIPAGDGNVAYLFLRCMRGINVLSAYTDTTLPYFCTNKIKRRRINPNRGIPVYKL